MCERERERERERGYYNYCVCVDDFDDVIKRSLDTGVEKVAIN